jgi:hypothetical protein
LRKVVKIVLSTLAYLVVFDLIGVAVCSFFDIASALPLRIGATSTLLFYTIWVVLGIFCGLLSYDTGGKIGSANGPGDWTSREGAGRTGLLVVCIESGIVGAISILCYLFQWRHGSSSGFYIPDNAPVSLVFFVAILASIVVAHTCLRPQPGK